MLANKIALAALLLASALAVDVFPTPQGAFAPRAYLCPRAAAAPVIDGQLDEWPEALFSGEFADITGEADLAPTLSTRVAMMWDDEYFYIAARMQEPHLWGTLMQHDAVIFRDNDFEVFIDPDNDTHLYYEYEINALGTDWDLLLLKPYRDRDEVAVNAFEITGMRRAVSLQGTLNDPRDEDTGWCVELAFPWDVLRQCANNEAPPRMGNAWRVNFSRVEWQLDVVNGAYAKKPGTAEENWVWSPQGLVAMHYPERWGVVTFSGGTTGGEVPWQPDEAELARQRLRQVYYAQKQFHMDYGRWAGSLGELGLAALHGVGLDACGQRYTATLTASGTTYAIHEDGWVGILKDE